MPCVREVRQWEIRPTSALRGIRRTRALMWQRIQELARACRHGAGYPVNYDDPDREEQEMVCLEPLGSRRMEI
ncbi:regulator of G-protein signaling 20 isoform X1 [Lates japonicus]|uniref:Regulator of G-protein signaling 20 isoform X1 n=1 Tax=Lates japonicus TaxID=270547 RepID=A0AAD3MAR8_LATJO|nr:regulator of G-protein signaling 20 isoform X1 [Lates japonicus]